MSRVLRDRYELKESLGKGGQGVTYRAYDRVRGLDVVVKECHLGRVTDWKAIELFERGGRALKNLEHARIPAYIDAFQDEEDTQLYLVQEFIEGEDLRKKVDQNKLMREADARGFLGQMLDVLEYLHGLSPPMVHRDVKPSNIIQRVGGEYALIDFGAVQALMSGTEAGSTVVGTHGYMAPEQLLAQAQSVSDIYSLGMTVVHLVTGVHPADLPMTRMKVEFRDVADVSAEFASVLDRMIEPSVRTRFKNVGEVRTALAGEVVSDKRIVGIRQDDGFAVGPSEKIQELLKMWPVNSPVCAVQVEGGVMEASIPFLAVGFNFSWFKSCLGILSLAGAMCLLSGLGLFSLLSNSGGLFVVCTILFIGLMIGGIVFWENMRQRYEVLRISKDAVELHVYKKPLWMSSKSHWLFSEEVMSLSDIASVHLDFSGKEVVHQNNRSTVKSQGKGIIWTSRSGEKITFGSGLVRHEESKNRYSPEFGELRWIYDLIEAYSMEVVVAKSSTDFVLEEFENEIVQEAEGIRS